MWRTFQALPLRERSILRLIYQRGASERELAGALGISRSALRRMVDRILERVADPLLPDLIASWRLLAPDERRVAYLHRILGLPLREIARNRLIETPKVDGRTGSASSEASLRALMNQVERKVQRGK